MNLVLLLESDRIADAPLGSQRFRLDGDRARHVLSVLRVGEGGRFRVGLLNAGTGEATVLSATSNSIEIDAELDLTPEPRVPTDLLLAVPRPKSLKKLLPEVAALGVDRLVLFRSWRVDPAYLEVKLLFAEAQAPLLHAGLMQARSTQAPAVTVEPLFKPFVEDRLPGMVRAGTRAFVAHPDAQARVADLALGADEHVILAVGPEGGFIPYELDALQERGFVAVSMGPRPLRVETACVALLAQISLLRQRA